MVIPVAVMQCVAVAIVNVVNVVAVRNCHMATVRAMLVLMVGVGVMLGGFTLIPVAVMLAVQVAVVNIVNVVAVRNCHMATVRAVLVGVVLVNYVGHDVETPLSRCENLFFNKL
ncbi:hypothetical protein BKD74_08065 [Corynebacterium diphtheriae]|nr:hypothetical protein BKD74_08065 [Corynebacterium diphtheriae]